MKSILFCLCMILIFLSSNEKKITLSPSKIPLLTSGVWMGICPKGCHYTGGSPRCSCYDKKEYDPCANIKGWGGKCPCGSLWENGKCVSYRTTKFTSRITHWLKREKQN